ncbi:MAG: hypothetical protein JRI96_12125 [Deltaproteobacteria bacterium]|nr:hypothetical protein [Deltaproteobacteria bacterium]
MGLMIHSLGELPANVERDYYVYLLDYGWNEPLGEVLTRNFEKMADKASRQNAIVFRGVVGSHFSDEVLSWHQVNGQPGEEILPAILITTRNPHEFHERCFRDSPNSKAKDRMLLIPLRKSCKTTSEVVTLIDKIFKDIKEKKKLTDFEISKELKQGQNGALVDALILQPNISGIGINLNTIINFFKKKTNC